jgi:hypothetical protein
MCVSTELQSRVSGGLSAIIGKKFSQNNEDGVIDYIFEKIKAKSLNVVEMSIGGGKQSCSAHLIVNHNWNGILYEMSKIKCKNAKNFYTLYNKCPEINNITIKLDTEFTFYDKLIDLFIIDLDSIDYYILEKIINKMIIKPRVLCVEMNDIIPLDMNLIIPYEDNFDGWAYNRVGGPNYSGASIKAYIELLKPYYNYIGCEKRGFNGFFLRNDIIHNDLPPIEDYITYHNRIQKYKKWKLNKRFKLVENCNWINKDIII